MRSGTKGTFHSGDIVTWPRKRIHVQLGGGCGERRERRMRCLRASAPWWRAYPVRPLSERCVFQELTWRAGGSKCRVPGGVPATAITKDLGIARCTVYRWIAKPPSALLLRQVLDGLT